MVDHEERRRELAEAVWRVVLRDGIEEASVRSVAAEAGWSTGSLRHYFPTQSALLKFAMQVAAGRFAARVEPLRAHPDPRYVLRAVCLELLPLDEQRRAEMAVWLSFYFRARLDESLRDVEFEMSDGLVNLYRRMLTRNRDTGNLRPGIDVDRASLGLEAYIDGLATHALYHPDRYDNDTLVALVDEHLATLLVARDPASSGAGATH
ncbi:TetR/AcrR family transcriptional regulator [Longimycelium tulufanense]|uniref:TetR/AcrR family transcriptional regulator n=1 Tax=Longimycelium tulufanense TaxID=907463 RepID=UPI001E4AFA8F|nr:TetR family transcriptional regulator C-terminal domain-containing protein [Longimycelium tulufanense]